MNQTVTITHLSILRSDFLNYAPKVRLGLSIKEVKPTYTRFETILNKVGEAWYWTKRQSFLNGKQFYAKVMADPETRLFILQKYGKDIGLCLVIVPTKEAIPYLREDNAIEIKWYGLCPEETGKAYGGFYLNEIFSRLLSEYDEVYLSTRSTNHAKVVPFYQKMGMQVQGQEIVIDDTLWDNVYKRAS